MKTCSTCTCQKPLTLRLSPYQRDEKLPFIERVLGLLVESRFANGRAQGLAEFSQPRDIADVCLDLHPQPVDIPLGRRFIKFLNEVFSKPTGSATATGVAAYALTCTQLANSRGP